MAHSTFNVEIKRDVDQAMLSWPEPGEALAVSGLGGNRSYADLRRLPWREAKRVLALETELLARLEAAADPEDEYSVIEDELYEQDLDLYGLDVGIAAAVVSLSSAGCIPFSSCNAGAFGGQHQESYPLVAFYARPEAIDLLTAAAQKADVGIENGRQGCIVLYTNDVSKMLNFAEAVIRYTSVFRQLRRPRRKTAPEEVTEDQLSLEFSSARDR